MSSTALGGLQGSDERMIRKGEEEGGRECLVSEAQVSASYAEHVNAALVQVAKRPVTSFLQTATRSRLRAVVRKQAAEFLQRRARLATRQFQLGLWIGGGRNYHFGGAILHFLQIRRSFREVFHDCWGAPKRTIPTTKGPARRLKLQDDLGTKLLRCSRCSPVQRVTLAKMSWATQMLQLKPSTAVPSEAENFQYSLRSSYRYWLEGIFFKNFSAPLLVTWSICFSWKNRQKHSYW